ncbi:MAG: NADH-quinone oxidoreductase subunit H [Pseudomonadota bacterium]
MNTHLMPIINFILGLVLSPLLLGIINKTKAFFAGRNGPPLLQLYYDLDKLFRKGAVYSRTTTWVFKAVPFVGVAAAIGALLITPFASEKALLAFPCDVVLLAYWLGLMRFFTVLAALDTGSAFEGMGASREVQFALLAEPAILLGMAALACMTGSLSLSEIYARVEPQALMLSGSGALLVAGALFVAMLAETARVPVDDPNTHLELTMIHEVMVLDHSGVDFGMILYGAALKLWVLGALFTELMLPFKTNWMALNLLFSLACMAVLAVFIGVIESSVARLRLLRVPQFLTAAIVMSALAMILVIK